MEDITQEVFGIYGEICDTAGDAIELIEEAHEEIEQAMKELNVVKVALCDRAFEPVVVYGAIVEFGRSLGPGKEACFAELGDDVAFLIGSKTEVVAKLVAVKDRALARMK